YCTPARQMAMLKVILRFHDEAARVIRLGAPVSRLSNLPVVPEIMRMRFSIKNEDAEAGTAAVSQAVETQMRELAKDYTR
ncbi:MAG: hypothetical protein ACYC1C_01830, partial [Chloroflexota bacterium]